MGNISELKSYIIKRFIAIIIILSFVEYANMSFIRRTVISFVVKMFFEGQSVDDVTSYGIMIGMVLAIVLIVLELLCMLLPKQIEPYIEGYINQFRIYIAKALLNSDSKINISNVTLKKEVLLLFILLGMFILIMLPLIIAALYFSSVVLKEFNAIEEAEKKKQEDYDKRRNLMLSDIAHDLRTPITTVSGYAMALSDGMVEEDKKQEYLV